MRFAYFFAQPGNLFLFGHAVLDQLQQFQARKALGQNFLFDENIVRKIVAAIAPSRQDFIIEVGPGFGALTKFLLESNCRYLGVEVDSRLVPELEAKFGEKENFTLKNEDFLKLDLGEIANRNDRVRIIGNIPYHITSQIIFNALEARGVVKDLVLMIQREVADRIVAGSGNKTYGILSVVSQTFSTPEILFKVSRNVFIPKPDIESAVVRWDFSRPSAKLPENDDFFRNVVRTVFNHRRKTLANTLKKFVDPAQFGQTTGLDLRRRPEELTVEEHVELSNKLIRFRKEHQSRSR